MASIDQFKMDQELAIASILLQVDFFSLLIAQFEHKCDENLIPHHRLVKLTSCYINLHTL